MPTIRRAKPREAAQLTELALRSKAHWGYDDEFMAACRHELTLEPSDVEANATFVLEDGEELLGFYALEQVADDRMELNGMFVEPTAIGRGLGRALIEHAKSCVRQHGLRILEIQSDPHAAGFYAAFGARRVGERPSASIPGRVLPVFELHV